VAAKKRNNRRIVKSASAKASAEAAEAETPTPLTVAQIMAKMAKVKSAGEMIELSKELVRAQAAEAQAVRDAFVDDIQTRLAKAKLPNPPEGVDGFKVVYTTGEDGKVSSEVFALAKGVSTKGQTASRKAGAGGFLVSGSNGFSMETDSWSGAAREAKASVNLHGAVNGKAAWKLADGRTVKSVWDVNKGDKALRSGPFTARFGGVDFTLTRS
jgi:hypothetical protein